MAKRKTVGRKSRALVTAEQIDGAILVIRGQKVLLDEQLAVFYGVEVKRLMEAVKRNIGRFPDDFMFQLERDEWVALRSQFATLDGDQNLRSQFATSSLGHGGRRYPPYAFTEQGVAMLSSVLRSPRAIEVNIEIMRAFVRLAIVEFAQGHSGAARQVREADAGPRRGRRPAVSACVFAARAVVCAAGAEAAGDWVSCGWVKQLVGLVKLDPPYTLNSLWSDLSAPRRHFS